MGKSAAFQRWAKKLDRDPSKWPVAPGSRVYMVDCEFCVSRMPLTAMTFHIRRHQRKQDAGAKDSRSRRKETDLEAAVSFAEEFHGWRSSTRSSSTRKK